MVIYMSLDVIFDLAVCSFKNNNGEENEEDVYDLGDPNDDTTKFTCRRSFGAYFGSSRGLDL